MGGIEKVVQRDLLMDQLEMSFLMRKRREEYIEKMEHSNKKLKKQVKNLKRKLGNFPRKREIKHVQKG
jgi:predicted translin family RNA/ssDNA-binding protein